MKLVEGVVVFGMASRALTPGSGGKTPLSERISMFEGNPAGPTTTPAKIQLTKKPTVSTSKNFSAIKNQFDVSGSGVSLSPPSSGRNSLTLTAPVPAVRNVSRQDVVVESPKTSVTKKQVLTSQKRTVEVKVESNKAVVTRDDSFNGNLKTPLDNLNVLNLNNKLNDSPTDLAPTSSPDLDNVKRLKTTANLNLKNITSSTSPTSGGVTSPPAVEVRTSYWSNQALQNDNAQRISEVYTFLNYSFFTFLPQLGVYGYLQLLDPATRVPMADPKSISF